MNEDAEKMWNVLSTSTSSIAIRELLNDVDLRTLAKLMEEGIVSRGEVTRAILGNNYDSQI